MADIEAYYDEEELFQDRSDNIADLQAYYMSQFNLELETGNKNKSITDNFKYGNEESFDFEILETSLENNHNTNIISADFEASGGDINEYNIKEVLLDLDNIDFDDTSYTNESCNESKVQTNVFENNDYIDDESLLDELCREDGESCRLTPESYNEQYFAPITNEKNSLPSIETAFSKHYCNFNSLEENNSAYFTYENVSDNQTINNSTVAISSLEHYSYPNNILFNLENEKTYILPDTPTSCSEFNFRGERKVSVSESIESDLQSSSYYDENSETFDEDELFVNLEDFGLILETENGIPNTNKDEEKRIGVQNERRYDKDKTQGERICLWEHCYEKYPSQSTLVEHIERAHVNTYKGDEFSCLWRDCARSRRPFNARYKLLIHMRVHSGHKPNRCHHPGCGKAFSRLENLKIHVRSHTGERPYACPAPHCRKAFSNSSDRAKHQRTHFNARPYACGAAGCGKRYTDPSSLRKHVKSHPHPAVRTCVTPPRPTRRPPHAHLVPTSPAKLATLRSIRDKINVPRLQRL